MKCKVMGIVNVTPDSFSDGGKFFTPEEAVRRARNLINEGADIIDLGGESTRPGATPLSWQEEWSRLEPVLSALKGVETPISIDTYHPETMAEALKAGATIINCVYPEPIPEMMKLMKAYPQTEIVLPESCADDPTLAADFAAMKDRIILDPMIGFGTTREEDLAILQSIDKLALKGRVLIGASRKRIVKKLTGVKVSGKDLAGNVTIALWAALNGAEIVRVHDVKETVQALSVLDALRS